ncbi:enoyl-CoA delta isomerase [Chloropicon primus]|uniref:Enoyl-CoA delta isomerase n=1 Tax=Chloropicon primus TaxID=1764295 RepID=A0A5B8MQ22_9CHLO|nr:enoyl-CoA delta isomerase [Chloropicon primus]UPR00926.1 enoyl-CoA delta isomerase [Chloropicon primus]|mmetsp:Transcript_9385/g.26705  ORF Transcript_9385/g.26705 Transcript_9385/m.26705 type:complete len:263 (-) Transcript_9385:202-990(-)|eukprot:QDZ21705.1 enoyl-CoA delta isomerase [Chloropicon primus]
MYRYLQIERKGAYAIVRICKEPVNSMNLDLWSELDKCLYEIEQDVDIKGLVLASGLKRSIFTAGNDLKELYAKATSKTRFTDFWRAQTHFLAHLNRTSLVTVAAIKGACPAGGCITALGCDYRIMTEKGYIGLNEVLIGLPVPKLWCKQMERLIGARHAQTALMTGKMFKPKDALAVGLVNQVVPEENLLATAEAVVAKWVQIPSFGVATTKKFLKEELAQELDDFCEEEATETWQILSSPKIIGLMEKYLKGLSKPSKAKM